MRVVLVKGKGKISWKSRGLQGQAQTGQRLKVHGSLAKKGLDELLEKGLIKLVVSHSAQMIYTRNAREEASEEREVEEVKVVKAPKEKKAKVNKKDAAFEAAAEALAAEEA